MPIQNIALPEKSFLLRFPRLPPATPSPYHMSFHGAALHPAPPLPLSRRRGCFFSYIIPCALMLRMVVSIQLLYVTTIIFISINVKVDIRVISSNNNTIQQWQRQYV